MRWIVNYAILSVVSAFLVDRLLSMVFSGARDGAAGVARAGLSVGTGTAVAVGSGMRGFTERIRRWRKTNRDIGKRL